MVNEMENFDEIKSDLQDLRDMVEQLAKAVDVSSLQSVLARLDQHARIINDHSVALEQMGVQSPSQNEDDAADDDALEEDPLLDTPKDPETSKNVDPDAYSTGATGSTISPSRKSIEYCPDIHATVQLNEFDDAPSVGNLSIKRAGKKLLLTDPDGTSGQRKWMVPLRRETTGAIELKWAQLGEGSDSDSDSDSDYDDPCQDVYSLEDDGSDSDCGTTIKLMRQSYKRGTGGECEPDGQPESAGSVTIPDPPTITATSTGNTGGGQLAGTVTVTPCGGTATNINIYNGADGSDGDDVCAPEIKENQLNISDTGSDANHFVKLCEAKAGYLFNNGSTDVCIRGNNFFIIPIPKKLYASFALKKGQGVLSGNAVSYSGGGLTIEADVYEYATGSNSFWEKKELAILSQGDLRQALGGANYNIDFVADIEVSNNVVYVVKKTLNFDGGLCTGTTGTTRTPIFGFTNCT